MNQAHGTYRNYQKSAGPPLRQLSELIERAGIIVVTLLSCLAFTTHCDMMSAMVLFLWSLLIGYSAVAVYRKTRTDPYLNPLMTFFAAYLWVALPIKAIASQMGTNRAIFDDFGVPTQLFNQCLYPSIAYSIGGLLAIAVSFALLRRFTGSRQLRPSRINPNFVLLVLVMALPIKYVAHFQLGWGVPGMQPRNVVPLVTGAVVIFCRLGIFHLIASLLFCAFYGRLTAFQKLLLAVCLLTFVGLDFGNGSKYSAAFFVAALSFILGDRLSFRGLGFAKSAMIVGVIVAFVFVLPIVQQYRFARLKRPHATVLELIEEAQARAKAKRDEEDPFFKAFIMLTKRINGFQNYCAARYFERRVNLGWKDLVDSSESTQRYTEAVTNIVGNTNSYGLTQLSFVSAVANHHEMKIIFYSAAYNLILLLIICIPPLFLINDVLNLRAAGISLGLFFLHVQFGGGDLFFLSKQLIVIFATIWVVSRFPPKNVVIRRPAPPHARAPARRSPIGSH